MNRMDDDMMYVVMLPLHHEEVDTWLCRFDTWWCHAVMHACMMDRKNGYAGCM